MYAIIKTGGKQYTVKEGDVIDVELLSANPGDQVQFEALYAGGEGSQTHVGTPIIPNFAVSGLVIGTVQGEKITSRKYKRSHNQQRQWGHRQENTRVQITSFGSHHKK